MNERLEIAATTACLVTVVVTAAVVRPETRPELLGAVFILAAIGTAFAVRGWLDRNAPSVVDALRRIGGL